MLGTGEGESLVSNHCLKSRVSLEGVVVVAFLGGESTLDDVPFKDVGGTKSASACPSL